MPTSAYSEPNKITLDTLEWVIDGAVERAPAEEYAVGLRMGPPDYDAREGAFFKNFNDFRGGLGVRVGSAREFPDRFWGSRDIRTWDSEGDITLAPLLVEATLGTIVPSASAGLYPGGGWAMAPDSAGAYTLFGAMGNKVFTTTGTIAPVFTDITPGGGPANAQTFALVYHTDPTDLTDRAIFWATGGAADIWKRNLVAGTWSQPAAGRKSDDLIVFDGKLLSVLAGQIAISADGGVTWTDIIKVQSDANFKPGWAGIGLDPYGQLMPYLVSAGILYAVDVWTHQAIPVDLGLPSSVTVATVWQDGEVIASDGYYVKAYHPNRPVKNMGFDRDNGVISLVFIRSLYTVAGKYLVAQVDGGNGFNLYMWDGAGWHVITGSDAIFGPFGVWSNPGSKTTIQYNGASVFNPAQELFVMAYSLLPSAPARPYIYHMSADAFKNPQLNGAHKYAGGVLAHIITPYFDGGFAEMNGTAIEFEIHGLFTTNEYVEVQYRLDNSTGAWTSLGTTNGTATVHRLRFGTPAGQGIEFKNIQFQFLLKRTVGNNLLTPVVRAMVFKFIKVPRLRSRYSFTIDVEATARHRGETEEVVIDYLNNLIDGNPLYDFSYTGESTVYVRFVNVPRIDQQRQDGTTKTSTFRVTVEEPV